MKVIDNRKNAHKVRFEELEVGDGYLDDEGNICIKTSDTYEDINCMYYREPRGEWVPECEYNYTEVRPLAITLTIEG